LTDDAQNVEAQVTQLMHGLIDKPCYLEDPCDRYLSYKTEWVLSISEAEFSRLHQGLLSVSILKCPTDFRLMVCSNQLAPLEAPEPVDFEIRVARFSLRSL
jgi:hypothetical protein